VRCRYFEAEIFSLRLDDIPGLYDAGRITGGIAKAGVCQERRQITRIPLWAASEIGHAEGIALDALRVILRLEHIASARAIRAFRAAHIGRLSDIAGQSAWADIASLRGLRAMPAGP